MLHNEPRQISPVPPLLSGGRIGNLAAMLRVMQPLNIQLPDATNGQRRLLADLCRFIGVKVGTLSPESLGLPPGKAEVLTASSSESALEREAISIALPPRQEQTLGFLLDGFSEKQVARKLKLSQHTVHSHVKSLYRRFGVSSRAELLARHLKK